MELEEEKFRRFDIVNDDSDHSYRDWNKSKKKGGKPTDGSDCFSNASSGVHKKIMKEWRVLEKSLPETIYVRVYERRIDLLRAAIVGPAGTPYHDGLFVFDLSFPTDYPARPPNVHYRSFGLRINPNLYANGRVCLSLLNTWVGKPNEKWNPAESTVLQILVSIQGLVLNSNPYFNEPGTGLFPGQSKRSMAYSENAFVLSCTTMVYLLRKPPKNFEALVTSHFRDRANYILAACNAYVNGRAVVGCYGGEMTGSGSSSSGNPVKVSSNFQTLMKSWYPHMVVVFKRAGASLGHSVEQLRVEVETPSSEGNAATKKKKKTTSSKEKAASKKKMATATKSGIGKVIEALKKFLGLKKVLGGKKGLK